MKGGCAMSRKRKTRNTRRKRKSQRNQGIAPKRLAILVSVVVALWLIYQVATFLFENPWILYTIIVVVILAVAGWIAWTVRRYQAYKATPFYKDTKTPFWTLKKPSVKFECDVYNELSRRYPQAKMLANVLIPRNGAVNEYFEIDILMFSPKGTFALELKDWSGFIYGHKDNKRWTVGRKKGDDRTAIDVYNPYKQNQRHIEDLEKVYSFDYFNHVIFSERGDIGEGMEDVSKLDGFIARYERLENQLSAEEINEHYEAIAAKLDPSNLPKHIERIKFNKKKYS